MKQIRLREGEMHKAREIFIICMGQGGAQGINIAEMGTRLSIITKLKGAEGKRHITLPNDEHQMLKDVYTRFPFATVHQDLVDFAEDLKEASDVKIEAVPANGKKQA